MEELVSENIVVHIDPDLEELIPGFLANRHNDVVALRELIGKQDFVAIRLIGHSMKGAGGGYGFDPITEFGSIIEEAALTKDSKAILGGVAALADYLARVEPTFR